MIVLGRGLSIVSVFVSISTDGFYLGHFTAARKGWKELIAKTYNVSNTQDDESLSAKV